MAAGLAFVTNGVRDRALLGEAHRAIRTTSEQPRPPTFGLRQRIPERQHERVCQDLAPAAKVGDVSAHHPDGRLHEYGLAVHDYARLPHGVGQLHAERRPRRRKVFRLRVRVCPSSLLRQFALEQNSEGGGRRLSVLAPGGHQRSWRVVGGVLPILV
jgi:hypothetical protein